MYMFLSLTDAMVPQHLIESFNIGKFRYPYLIKDIFIRKKNPHDNDGLVSKSVFQFDLSWEAEVFELSIEHNKTFSVRQILRVYERIKPIFILEFQ